jgi:hypothetical protein
LPYRGPMAWRMPIAVVALVTAGTLLGAGRIADAGDEAKRDCRQGCDEARESCKSDCRNERDSGTQQQSDRYTSCDSGCRDTYESCKSDCDGK